MSVSSYQPSSLQRNETESRTSASHNPACLYLKASAVRGLPASLLYLPFSIPPAGGQTFSHTTVIKCLCQESRAEERLCGGAHHRYLSAMCFRCVYFYLHTLKAEEEILWVEISVRESEVSIRNSSRRLRSGVAEAWFKTSSERCKCVAAMHNCDWSVCSLCNPCFLEYKHRADRGEADRRRILKHASTKICRSCRDYGLWTLCCLTLTSS